MFDSRARTLSRRYFLCRAASGAAALAPATTLAREREWSIRQTIHKSGTLEVTVLSDGHFLLPTGFLLAPDAPAAERDEVLKAAPPVGDQLRLPNNIAVIRRASDLILIDAGAGPHHQPTSGKLAGSLEAAGIEPAAVTIVVLTHGHPDHLWGVLDAGGNFIVRTAAYVISARELEVWSDPNVLRTLPPAVANDRIVGGARSHLAPIKDRIRTVRGGDDIISGVRAIEDSRTYAGPYLPGAVRGRRIGHRRRCADTPHRLLPAPFVEGRGGS